VAPGANYRLCPEDLLAARDLLAGADLILCQNEIPPAATDCVCQLARELGRPMLLNPAPITAHGVPTGWLQAATLLVPNEVEAGHLLGRPIASVEEARAAARAWVAQGIPVVVITLGSRGVVAATAEGDCHLPALAVTPVDTVGAGDCFIGALAFALCSGQDLHVALFFANAAAALAVTRPGAQQSMPYRLEVEALLGEQPAPAPAEGTPRLAWRLPQ
jgi:ribokinase